MKHVIALLVAAIGATACVSTDPNGKEGDTGSADETADIVETPPIHAFATPENAEEADIQGCLIVIYPSKSPPIPNGPSTFYCACPAGCNAPTDLPIGDPTQCGTECKSLTPTPVQAQPVQAQPAQAVQLD